MFLRIYNLQRQQLDPTSGQDDWNTHQTWRQVEDHSSYWTKSLKMELLPGQSARLRFRLWRSTLKITSWEGANRASRWRNTQRDQKLKFCCKILDLGRGICWNSLLVYKTSKIVKYASLTSLSFTWSDFLAAIKKKYNIAVAWNVTFAEGVSLALTFWKLVHISFPQGKTETQIPYFEWGKLHIIWYVS